jgi:hypothetical protein
MALIDDVAMIRGLWLLFAAPGWVRRRIRARRGQCPACAYPVGASTVCTECGRPVGGTVHRMMGDRSFP